VRSEERSCAADQAPRFWQRRSPNCGSVQIEHRKGHSAAGRRTASTLASTRGVPLNDFAGVSRCVAWAGRTAWGRSRPRGGGRRRSFGRPWLCGIGAEVGPVGRAAEGPKSDPCGGRGWGRETLFGGALSVCIFK
jgi:hypothetical protein